MKIVLFLVPLIIFFAWVYFGQVTGPSIWAGFFVAIMCTIGLGEILGLHQDEEEK